MYLCLDKSDGYYVGLGRQHPACRGGGCPGCDGRGRALEQVLLLGEFPGLVRGRAVSFVWHHARYGTAVAASHASAVAVRVERGREWQTVAWVDFLVGAPHLEMCSINRWMSEGELRALLMEHGFCAVEETLAEWVSRRAEQETHAVA